MRIQLRRPRFRASCRVSSLVCIALLGVACSRESEPAPPPAPPAAEAPAPVPETPLAAPPAPAPPSAAQDGNANDGAFTGDDETPSQLAPDVPLYAQAVPVSSMASAQLGTVVNLRTQDPIEQVAAWYGTELPARGWEIEKQTPAAASHLTVAHKGGRKATVLITRSTKGTQILLAVLEEP